MPTHYISTVSFLKKKNKKTTKNSCLKNPFPAPDTNESTSESQQQLDEKMVQAINASLQKLSNAASSGRINGGKLYDIILREMQSRDGEQQQAPTDQAATATTATLVEVKVEKPPDRMYFGQAPLEYVPQSE